MVYPMVMLTVSFLTVLVLVVFVMPKFMEVFREMHAEIPLSTRLMIDLGTLIRGEPWQCLCGFIATSIELGQVEQRLRLFPRQRCLPRNLDSLSERILRTG